MTAVVSVTILEMVWLDSRKRYDREDWLSPDAKYLVQRKYVLQNVENMRLKTMRGKKGMVNYLRVTARRSPGETLLRFDFFVMKGSTCFSSQSKQSGVILKKR